MGVGCCVCVCVCVCVGGGGGGGGKRAKLRVKIEGKQLGGNNQGGNRLWDETFCWVFFLLFFPFSILKILLKIITTKWGKWFVG